MDIVEERSGSFLVVKVAGSLDTTSFGKLESWFHTQFAAGERRFVFDLSDLEYISSAGLRVFAVVLKKVRAENGTLLLCSLRDQVKKVFDIAGFSAYFQFFPSLQEVLAAAER